MKVLGPAQRLPLFAYGTLLDVEFAGRLLERALQVVPARLLDFEIVRLERFPYPTLFQAAGEVVDGSLYRDLTPEDYDRLDAYEGVLEGLYQRVEVRVVAREPGSSSTPEPAFVYLATEKTLRRYGVL